MFTSCASTLNSSQASTVTPVRRIPSTLMFYDTDDDSSIPAITIYSALSSDIPSCSVSCLSSTTTQMIDCHRYKVTGCISNSDALKNLESVTAVLFYSKDGEESRQLMALRLGEKRFLLRVIMEHYENGDSYWGIQPLEGKMTVGFRSKECMVQYYAMAPGAALLTYFGK